MEKIRVYLDTNMVLDVFINHAKALKRNEEALLPKKYAYMLANKEKIEFVASFLSKAEVVRELVSGYGVSYEEVMDIWSKFMKSLDCEYIGNFEFGDGLVELAGKAKMRLRTMFNFMHIFIAISYSAYFISGDRDAVRKSIELGIYSKAVAYESFRKMIEGEI